MADADAAAASSQQLRLPAAETFRQIPINALMDHNDSAKRVGDDLAHVLKVLATEEDRMGGALYRVLRHDPFLPGTAAATATATATAITAPSIGNGSGSGSEGAPAAAATTMDPSSLPSIDAAFLAMRGFLSSLAQAHTRFGRSVVDEVRRPLEALLGQQHQQHTRIKLEWNRIVKEFYTKREALGKAKRVVAKAFHDQEAAGALYDAAAQRRSVSMAAFTSDLDKAKARCLKAQQLRAQAERVEREAKAELYEAIAERDDFIKHAARAYQDMEERRLREFRQAMLAVAQAERAHLQARLKEVEAFERAAEGISVGRDVGRMVAERKDPESTHAYNRALVILDWAWQRQMRGRLQEQQQGRQGQGGEQADRSTASSTWSTSAAAAVADGPRSRPGGEEEEEEMSGIDAILDRLLLSSSSPPPSSSQPPPVSLELSSSISAGGGAPLPPLGEGAPFEALIGSERGRAYFIQQLNDKRGRMSTRDVGAGYEGLGECLRLLLDKCQEAHDVRAAQQVMAMANTYFRSSSSSSSSAAEEATDGSSGGGGLSSFLFGGLSPSKQQQKNQPEEQQEKEYLLTQIRAHPIWRDRRLWEDALMLGVAHQFELCPQARPWDELSGDALKGEVIGVHNVIFGQLASLVVNMRESGLPKEDIVDFVATMCDKTQLGEEQVAALGALVAGMGR